MSVIAKYERRHSICNDDISLGRTGYDDSSTDTTSICSSSSDFDDAMEDAKKSGPQHLLHRWKVEPSQVSVLPEIYPRLSSPLIIRDREVSEIGDHLWRFLRSNEIRSAYDREEGRVLCCTNRVSFVVQFWTRKILHEESIGNTAEAVASEYFPTIHDNVSSKNSCCIDKDCDEEIILEIQRRKGCSWTMHKIRAAMKKWILRKQQHHDGFHHKRFQDGMFPPPLQRSKSERFGLVGFDPAFLASNTKPLHTDTLTRPAVLTTTAQDVAPSPQKPSSFFTPPPSNKPPCSLSLPPLRPTFGVCPPPIWRSAKISSSEVHRFTIIE